MSKNDAVGKRAVEEAEAQLAITKVLGSLPPHKRQSVIGALHHLLQAEQYVPGIFARLTAKQEGAGSSAGEGIEPLDCSPQKSGEY